MSNWLQRRVTKLALRRLRRKLKREGNDEGVEAINKLLDSNDALEDFEAYLVDAVPPQGNLGDWLMTLFQFVLDNREEILALRNEISSLREALNRNQ